MSVEHHTGESVIDYIHTPFFFCFVVFISFFFFFSYTIIGPVPSSWILRVLLIFFPLNNQYGGNIPLCMSAWGRHPNKGKSLALA